MVTAFEKNSVNYERLQYYNAETDALNVANNYNPMLTITNKDQSDNLEVFRNYILFFNEKVRIAPLSVNYLNRGIFHCLTGNFNQSLEDLNKAIEMDPTSVIGHLSRGNCRYSMVEKIESLSAHQGEMAVSRRAGTGTPEKVSQVIPGTSDYDLILADFTRSVQLQPAFFFGYFNRAFIYLKLGRYPAAMEDLTRAIALEHEFAEAYYNRGLTKIYMNDTQGGALDLSKAGELGLVEAYSIIKRYCN